MSFPIISGYSESTPLRNPEKSDAYYEFAKYQFAFSNESGQDKARAQVADMALGLQNVSGAALLVGSGQLPGLVDVMPANQIVMVDRNPGLLEFWSQMHEDAARFASVGRMMCELASMKLRDTIPNRHIIDGMKFQHQHLGSDEGWFASQENYDRYKDALLSKDILGICGDLTHPIVTRTIQEKLGETPLTFANFTSMVGTGWLWPLPNTLSADRFEDFYGGIASLPWHEDAIVMWSDYPDIHIGRGIGSYLAFLDSAHTQAYREYIEAGIA